MKKDDITWLNAFYVFIGALAAFLAYKLGVMLAIQMGWEERYYRWLPNVRLIVSTIIGLGVFLLFKFDSAKEEYFLGALAELKKVTWPSWDDTRKMTIIVVIVVLIFSAVLAAFDFVWETALSWVL